MTRRLGSLLTTPFALMVLVCLAIVGWSAWTGGFFDDAVERHVRTSSFYAAPGVEVDREAAERIIGDRKLVVIMLEPNSDSDELRERCSGDWNAAANTLMLVLSQGEDEYDQYTCSHLPGAYEENFGKSYVAETVIASGIDQFADRPLDALKVVVVNYDLLVGSDTLPDGVREFDAPVGRYVVAGATVVAVVIGTTVAYLGARRVGRVAARRAADREAAGDARSRLSAASASLAQQIIELDRLYESVRRSLRRSEKERRAFERKYRAIVSEYTRLGQSVVRFDSEGQDANWLTGRVEELSERCRRLAATVPAR